MVYFMFAEERVIDGAKASPKYNGYEDAGDDERLYKNLGIESCLCECRGGVKDFVRVRRSSRMRSV